MAGDPHRPRLIWHGAGRTELSTASLANWSAKTAGLLIDELGAALGESVRWRVRRSWQGVPLLLGSWWAGMVVTDAHDVDVVAAFIDEDEDSDADEVLVASSHPFGLAGDPLPDFYRHVSDAVLPQADRFSPTRPAAAWSSTAIVTSAGRVTIAEVIENARQAAARIGTGGRLLSAVEPTLPEAVCKGLLGALAADGSLIQVAGTIDGAQLARIAEDERATVTYGVSVDGLPRLD